MDGMNVVGDLFGRGEDVPAPGRQERPGHEEGRRPPRPVHRGREGPDGSRRRNGLVVMATVKGDVHDIGKNIVGVVLSATTTRSSTWASWSRPAADPRDGPRAQRRPHRPVRADHAVARGDELRRRGDGARRLRDPAADRRRDDVADAHRGQDRAALPRPPVVHVLDASRAVGVAVALLDEDAGTRSPPRSATSTRRPARAGRPAGEGGAPPDRGGAPARASRSTGPASQPPRPTFLGVRSVRGLPARGARRPDRLDAVLRDVGAQGPLPADPRRPEARRGGPRPPRRRAGTAPIGSWTSGCSGRTGSSGSGRRTASATTSSCTRDDDRSRRHRRHPHAPPADGQAARPAEPRAGRLHRAAGDRPGRLRRRLRRHGRPRARGARRRVQGRARRLLGDPRHGARRPPRRGVRGAPPRAACAASCGATRRTRRSTTRR